MDNQKYDASSIEVIENLEAVRKRPGMYIGDTNSNGLHHLFKEIIDNSIDEHLAGYGDVINITLFPDNSISIEDKGRGIPVDIHPKTKKSALETVFTILHAGGKFGGDNSGYKVSGGLHGVGSSVVNALSEYLEITVWKDKKEYYLRFDNGGSKSSGLIEKGSASKNGTLITFRPDKKIFSTINFSGTLISQSLIQLAYLNPKLTINFDDKKNGEKGTYHFPKGIIEYVEKISKGKEEITKPYYFETSNNEITLKVAFKYCDTDIEIINSFVNNIITVDGGSHDSSFRGALTKAVNEYAAENKLQQGGKPLEGTDIRNGIFVIISAYVIESYLQFEGQTKSKLSSNIVKSFGDQYLFDELKHYLNSNKSEALKIIKKAYEAKRIRETAKRAKEVSKELKKGKGKSFAGKLVIAQSSVAENRELFIVEGDSAGGSAKLGRDRKTQAILPLRGKVVNTERATLKTILNNEELSMMIHAIGGGLGDEFNRKKANYGKIIIMTDADTDGAHIQTLLLTFFYRFMKELIEEGMIYIAMPPLFKATNKTSKEIKYFWDNDSLEIYKGKNKNIEIQRYKGLGEMNYQQLWETTMDPKTRTLVKVEIEDAEIADKIIETLMGQDPSIRRDWIENNIEFSMEDNYDNSQEVILHLNVEEGDANE